MATNATNNTAAHTSPAQHEDRNRVVSHRSWSDYVYWTPRRCRWDPKKPPGLPIWLNLLYAFASGFTSATLFYSHPILNVLAADFHTTQSDIATVPTMAQAGSAICLVFILPLADFCPRRRFILTMIVLSSIFWIGLCITDRYPVFVALTFLSALFSGTGQVLLPLVAEQSTPEKRAFNISITGTGPTMGILLARILSGIVANYTIWRNVYWMGFGLQILVLILLCLFMPDYPATNTVPYRKVVQQYPKILWSIITLYPKYPVLVQAALISFCAMFTLTSFWTTLTFLLAGSPYHYDSAIIGLFGLVGAATLVIGPAYSKYIITPLREPLYSAIVGNSISLTGIVVGTYAGSYTVAGPILQAFLQDAGLMVTQIANRLAIFPVEPLGRNRVNTAFVTIMYLGQLAGTKAGNDIYEMYGGWVAAGSLSVAVIGFGYIIAFARGPYESGWIGWTGGWGLQRSSSQKDIERRGSIAPPEAKAENGKNIEQSSLHLGSIPFQQTQGKALDTAIDVAPVQAAVVQDSLRRRSQA